MIFMLILIFELSFALDFRCFLSVFDKNIFSFMYTQEKCFKLKNYFKLFFNNNKNKLTLIITMNFNTMIKYPRYNILNEQIQLIKDFLLNS